MQTVSSHIYNLSFDNDEHEYNTNLNSFRCNFTCFCVCYSHVDLGVTSRVLGKGSDYSQMSACNYFLVLQ